MIVFDGDSTIAAGVHGVPEDKTWPYMLSKSIPALYVNMAKSESTAARCYLRLWKAIQHNPKWYVLQVGQWSCTQEPIDAFEHYVRLIIEEMNQRECEVLLITPPFTLKRERFSADPYRRKLLELAKIYRVNYLDLYGYIRDSGHSLDVAELFTPDGALCHFNESGHRFVYELFAQKTLENLCK